MKNTRKLSPKLRNLGFRLIQRQLPMGNLIRVFHPSGIELGDLGITLSDDNGVLRTTNEMMYRNRQISTDSMIAQVEAKHPTDTVPVSFDWHDYLANLWQAGVAFTTNQVIRPRRSAATGFQHRCTTGGVTGKTEPRWPHQTGKKVADGAARWRSESITNVSMRQKITSGKWKAEPDIRLSKSSRHDHVYTVLVAGGRDGKKYHIRHQLTLANGEKKEMSVILPVCRPRRSRIRRKSPPKAVKWGREKKRRIRSA